jgi:DNA-binding response OmpR family regulator
MRSQPTGEGNVPGPLQHRCPQHRLALREVLPRGPHLRSLTRRTLGARPTILSAAGLALDPAGRTATRDGVPLDLTSREVAVLEYLLRHKGHVVSKTELLEHCWDVNFDGEPAVIEVLMHRLRRKIERPGRPPAIQTVRREGYIIRDEA